MEIIFRLTIIFAPTKYRKIPKPFFKNHFTPKQTGIKINSTKLTFERSQRLAKKVAIIILLNYCPSTPTEKK
jgi:hypothetical protein